MSINEDIRLQGVGLFWINTQRARVNLMITVRSQRQGWTKRQLQKVMITSPYSLILRKKKTIFVAEGKDNSTVKAFSEDLEKHGGDAKNITDVSCDMSPAFI